MSQWLNSDQDDYMASLARIPREERCASGWHIIAQENCTCQPRADASPREAAPDEAYKQTAAGFRAIAQAVREQPAAPREVSGGTKCGFEWDKKYVNCDHRCVQPEAHAGEHCCSCGARKSNHATPASDASRIPDTPDDLEWEKCGECGGARCLHDDDLEGHAFVEGIPDTTMDLERALRAIEKFPRSAAALVAKEGIKAEVARYRATLEKLALCEPLSPESGAGYITHEVAARIGIAQEALKNV